MTMRCDHGCSPTAEKLTSNTTKKELIACLDKLSQLLREVENVSSSNNNIQ
jgi:hypothetical protein